MTDIIHGEGFRLRSCAQKRRWADERSAKTGSGHHLLEGRRYVYKCRICDGWHVTSDKGTAEKRQQWRDEQRKLSKPESAAEKQFRRDGRFAAQRRSRR